MKAAAALAAMRGFPLATLDAITGGAPPLVLAPHPDDESLGCGGLIAACCAQGVLPLVVVLTDGAGSHPGSRAYPAPRLRAVRAAEAAEAVRILGVPPSRLVFVGVADTAAPHAGPAFDAVVTLLAGLLLRGGCRTILAPWRHDPHGDHVAATAMAAAAARSTGVRLVEYPVWGWTLPGDADVSAPVGVRLDVSQQLATKGSAIRAHASQHAGLITDDPDGFQMTPAFMALFETGIETYILP